jgi:16S rRNA U516 pseudouridylate synthase RsuA-like enzyme
MLISLGNEVTYLKRTAIGPWQLADLGSSVYKELTEAEVSLALEKKITT